MTDINGLTIILNATTPEDLFGHKDDEKKAHRKYRQLLQASHPDMFIEDADKKVAEKAFVKVNEFWARFTGTSTKTNTIKTRKHEYVLGNQKASYDGFTLFNGSYDNGHEKTLLSFPNDHNDNDLSENQASILKRLNKEVPEDFKAFYPNFVENFRFKINNSLKNITAYQLPDGLYSLADVKEDYPEGIPARDVAWIFRRLLVAIGNANDIGVIHSGINLNSVLIHPEQHGLVLQDWYYAVEEGQSLVAVPNSFKTFYPEYVLKKQPVHKELDIYLAAKTMEALLREDAPRPLRAFFKGCQLKSVPAARHLLFEFDELIENMWGPKKFHVFAMRRNA